MKNKSSPSLRKIATYMLVVVLSLTLILSGFAIYTYLTSKNAEYERINKTIDDQVSYIDNQLYSVNQYLWDTIINNTNIVSIRDTDDKHQNNISARSLLNNFVYQSGLYDNIYSFYFLCPHRQTNIHNFSGGIDYSTNVKIQEQVKILIEMGVYKGDPLRWTYYIVDNAVYFIQIYRYQGSYIASWVSADKILSYIANFSKDSHYVLLDSSNNPSINTNYDIISSLTFDGGEVTGGKLGTEYFYKSFSRINANLLVYGSAYVNFENILTIFVFILIILIVVLGFSIYTLFYYKKYIQLPMLNLQNCISESVKQINDTRKHGFRELNEAAEAFDYISNQLNNLKIQYYEDKINHTKTELEYYQLQIKPHFLVNCFSIIFSMAQKKEFGRIQDFSLKLSKYIRFLFSDTRTTVPLRNEMNHVKEYLDIQNIRHYSDTEIIEYVNLDLLDCTIPPLIILTFVENSVKHNRGSGNQLKICIHIDGNLEQNRVKITIKDNGKGYTSESLKTFDDLGNYKPNENGDHIGISNIYKRLKLIYGEDFLLCFSNIPDGGAGVTIELPITIANDSK